MLLEFRYFPRGLTRALTMSYDDGTVHDRRLVEIFNRHGIRGTFHLNSTRLGMERFLRREEVAGLFAGHEVSAHSATHPFLDALPPTHVANEIFEDRRSLEELVGYPVRGLSYPCGTHNEALRRQLPALGIEYARTVRSTGAFDCPDDPLRWDPTCHHGDGRLTELADTFLGGGQLWRRRLFYVWGHSYEFDRQNNWELIESFCAKLGRRDDVWYATNIEVVDYQNAVRSLRVAATQRAILNPSAMDVWVGVGGEVLRIPPGATVRT